MRDVSVSKTLGRIALESQLKYPPMRRAEILSMTLTEGIFWNFENNGNFWFFGIDFLSIFALICALPCKNSFHVYLLTFLKWFFGLDYLWGLQLTQNTNQNNSSLFWNENVSVNKGFFLNHKKIDVLFLSPHRLSRALFRKHHWKEPKNQIKNVVVKTLTLTTFSQNFVKFCR